MQFYLRFTVDHLTLPLAYGYPLQSMLYRLMYPDPAYSAQLHDRGHSDGNRTFKLFCFGPLAGPHRVDLGKKQIVFFSEVLLELRTPDPRLAVLWQEALEPGLELRLCGQPLLLAQVEVDRQGISARRCRIRALSPILACRSYEQEGRRKTRFYNPLEPEFAQLVDQNFRGKYRALTGREPGKIRLTALSVGQRDKTVTRHKGTLLTGWGGSYLLQGAPEELSFLYDAGLGAKNAGGFGLFALLAEEEQDNLREPPEIF